MKIATTLIANDGRTDAQWFLRLVRRWERTARGIEHAILGDAGSGGDVTQEAFLKVWHHLSELRAPECFGAWFCGIVRNLAIDERRRIRRKEPMNHAAIREPRSLEDPLEIVLKRERFEVIARSLAELDEVSRIAIVLKYFDDQSSVEIAELLRMTTSAVDMRVYRARLRLRAAFIGPTAANGE